MSGFVVMVEFRIKPGELAKFVELVSDNARASLTTEPGCSQFDVVTRMDASDTIFLYEIYDDAAAFDAHKATAHFADFDKTSAPLVAHKTITIGDRNYPV